MDSHLWLRLATGIFYKEIPLSIGHSPLTLPMVLIKYSISIDLSLCMWMKQQRLSHMMTQWMLVLKMQECPNNLSIADRTTSCLMYSHDHLSKYFSWTFQTTTVALKMQEHLFPPTVCWVVLSALLGYSVIIWIQ